MISQIFLLRGNARFLDMMRKKFKQDLIIGSFKAHGDCRAYQSLIKGHI